MLKNVADLIRETYEAETHYPLKQKTEEESKLVDLEELSKTGQYKHSNHSFSSPKHARSLQEEITKNNALLTERAQQKKKADAAALEKKLKKALDIQGVNDRVPLHLEQQINTSRRMELGLLPCIDTRVVNSANVIKNDPFLQQYLFLDSKKSSAALRQHNKYMQERHLKRRNANIGGEKKDKYDLAVARFKKTQEKKPVKTFHFGSPQNDPRRLDDNVINEKKQFIFPGSLQPVWDSLVKFRDPAEYNRHKYEQEKLQKSRQESQTQFAKIMMTLRRNAIQNCIDEEKKTRLVQPTTKTIRASFPNIRHAKWNLLEDDGSISLQGFTVPIRIFLFFIKMCRRKTRRAHYKSLDDIGKLAWKLKRTDLEKVAKKLTTHELTCKSRRLQTLALYRWCIYHLPFHIPSHNSISKDSYQVLNPKTPTETFYDKTLVTSSDIAVLFQTMCNAAGIFCVVIAGYAKAKQAAISSPGHEINTPNHVWNMVFFDEQWHFIDIALGCVNEENKSAHSDAYFDTPKHIFDLDHYGLVIIGPNGQQMVSAIMKSLETQLKREEMTKGQGRGASQNVTDTESRIEIAPFSNGVYDTVDLFWKGLFIGRGYIEHHVCILSDSQKQDIFEEDNDKRKGYITNSLVELDYNTYSYNIVLLMPVNVIAFAHIDIANDEIKIPKDLLNSMVNISYGNVIFTSKTRGIKRREVSITCLFPLVGTYRLQISAKLFGSTTSNAASFILSYVLSVSSDYFQCKKHIMRTEAIKNGGFFDDQDIEFSIDEIFNRIKAIGFMKRIYLHNDISSPIDPRLFQLRSPSKELYFLEGAGPIMYEVAAPEGVKLIWIEIENYDDRYVLTWRGSEVKRNISDKTDKTITNRRKLISPRRQIFSTTLKWDLSVPPKFSIVYTLSKELGANEYRIWTFDSTVSD